MVWGIQTLVRTLEGRVLHPPKNPTSCSQTFQALCLSGLPSTFFSFFPPWRLVFSPQTHDLENPSPSFIKACLKGRLLLLPAI